MKICIIGTGLTSLTLAKTLVNLGLKVDLFLNDEQNIYDKSQTLGISASNIEFFNKNILKINHLLWGINNIKIFSENLKDEKILDFKNENKQLFFIVKNSELFSYLLSKLKKNKLLNIKRNKKANISNEDYNLIINTDFKNSINKKFFFNKFIKNYNSYGHVTIIEHKKIFKNNTAVQIFTENGPIAFLPISQNQTSVVYSAKGIKKIEKSKLDHLIKKNFKTNYIKKIYDPKSFELKSIDLRTYHYKNILAFGDLLHRLHPLAGQGFNMTIRDIKALYEIINYKINLGIQIDASTCVEFEKKVKPQNYLFSNGIDLIYEFFNIENKIKTSLISRSVKFLGKNKSLNKFFTKVADTGTVI